MLYPLSYECQWAELNFCPHKLSNLKFTLLPSLHVDFYSRHDVNSVLFFLHNCPLLIPLHNTAVLIKICRFLINVVRQHAAFMMSVLFAFDEGTLLLKYKDCTTSDVIELYLMWLGVVWCDASTTNYVNLSYFADDLCIYINVYIYIYVYT